MVPLSTLGSLKPIVGPETVPHYNNYGSALINGAAAPGYSSGQAVAAMQRAAASVLPRDFAFEWTGITFQELKAGSLATLIFGLAIVFVFLILAAQYESWSMPFMVLLAVPLALFGAFLALWVRQLQIDVYSQIGFVMLIGLAAKNAILIVEFAKRRREEGLSIVESAMEAGRLRLRPILMTAFAFILGVVPLMIATGAGAASRQSIGTTVFGGMVAATILTLIFVPVFYAVIEQFRERNPEVEREATHRPPRLRAPGRSGGIESVLPMKSRKLALLVGVVVVAASVVLVVDENKLPFGGGKPASEPAKAQSGPCPRMPVPVVSGGQEDDPDLFRLFGPSRVDSQPHAAGQGVELSRQNRAVADGADVKTGQLLYRIDQRDFQAALDQMKAAGRTRRRLAALPALEPRPWHRTRQERLPGQGQFRPAHQQRRPDRGGTLGRPRRGAHGAAEPRLYRDPRPVRRDGSGATRRLSARWSAPARPC